MTDLVIRIDDNKTFIVRGEIKKQVPKDLILELYQLILGKVAPNRDYTSVTSLNKLLRIIDLECEPDESDSESEPEPPVKPVKKAVSKPATTAKPVRGRAPPKGAAAKPKQPVESDSDSDSDSDSESDSDDSDSE